MADYGDGFWSEDTCKLTDIIEDLPTLVRVREGIYGGNEATTFSQGDLIKIDACKPMTRVTAHLTQPGSNTKYDKYGSEISLPYQYNGRVLVKPLHGEYYKYNTVKDLIEYFPRNVRVLSQVGYKDPTGNPQKLQAGTILELLAVRRNKSGFATSLRCNMEGQNIVLPRDTSGVFQVLPDDKEQTIRDVVDTYKLPQCVRFIGKGVQEIMSKDIQEAIHNLTTYTGELILTGKMESAPVLFGHYKGLAKDDASSQFCHRSAVVIPLDTPEIIDIDVQLPAYLDTSDYELFLLKNFSQSTSTPQFLEGALYADFTWSRKVQFIAESTPPAIPPRRKPREHHGKEEGPDTPPPVPRRPPRPLKQSESVTSQADYLNIHDESPKLKPKNSPPRVLPMGSVSSEVAKSPLYQVPSPSYQVPKQRAADGPSFGASTQEEDIYEPPESPKLKPKKSPPRVLPMRPPSSVAKSPSYQVPKQKAPEGPNFGSTGLGLGLGSLISDAFTREEGVYEETGTYVEPVPLPIAQKKYKQQFKAMLLDLVHKVRLDRGGDPSLGLEPPEVHNEDEDSSDDVTYDYIDEEDTKKFSKKFKPKSKPTLKVSPSVQTKIPVMFENALDKLSISDLETILTMCGMADLAKVCKRECIDGVLFASFSPEILKKKPFNLSDFNIKKVNEIRNGWRPKI